MDRRSFTLIELLLGLLIFAVISAGLYGVFMGAFKFDRTARRLHAYSRDVRLAFDVLSRDVENALPYPQVIDGETIAFEGSSARIVLYLVDASGLRRVEYFTGDLMRGQPSSGRYLLRQSQKLPDFWQKRPGTAELMGIVGGVSGDGFRFRFGRMDDQGRLAFQDQWKGAHLPDVVRVECSFGDQERIISSVDIFPVVKRLVGAGV